MDMGLPLATGHGANAAAARRLRLRVRGQVQGVGFRPHVWRLATRDKLLNDQEGVLLEVQGDVDGRWPKGRPEICPHPPFIGTLGMYGVARGAAYLLAGGMTVGIANEWFSAIGNGRVYGVPVLVIIAAVACLVLHYMLSQTRFGQHTYALGASKAAAGS